MSGEPPLLKVRHVQVKPIKTIHVNPRALNRQERRAKGAPRSVPPRDARDDGYAAASSGSHEATGAMSTRPGAGRDVPQQGRLVKKEDGAIVVDSSAVGRVTGKNVTINFPPNDPSGRRQFVGVVKNGKPHGEGMLVWESGSQYRGTFKKGDLNGVGSYYWANGTVYTGEWVNGAMHGQGTMTTATGDRYEGSWDANRKHGPGQYTWSNGDRYEGAFSDDVMHGKGCCSWPNGRIVEVEFEDEFPAIANRAATALWICFVTLSILFLASLFPSSPLRVLHNVWPFSMGLLPSVRRWEGADATLRRAGLSGIDWLSQFPYYLHLLLLFANQRLLREFFAQVIWKVAQMYCHVVGPSLPLLGALSDATTWRCGICLGYFSVCTFFLFSFSIVNAASYI